MLREPKKGSPEFGYRKKALELLGEACQELVDEVDCGDEETTRGVEEELAKMGTWCQDKAQEMDRKAGFNPF